MHLFQIVFPFESTILTMLFFKQKTELTVEFVATAISLVLKLSFSKAHISSSEETRFGDIRKIFLKKSGNSDLK